jgi:hypothetical protein
MNRGVEAGWVWWWSMLVVSCFNFVLLILASRRATSFPPKERTIMIAAASLFTLTCAYRAILPRLDVSRQCWFDSPANWTIFGRFFACWAEIGWATQMGLMLRRLAIHLQEHSIISKLECRRSQQACVAVIAIACFAECWSWTNLITESDLFSTVEQALWCVLFLVVGAGMLVLLRKLSKSQRPISYSVFAVLVILMGVQQGYEAFGLYFVRFLDEQRAGVPFQGFIAGLSKLASCATVTKDIHDWQDDFPWMTGYFSVGVWSSLWLAVAPLPIRPALLNDEVS